MLLKPGRLLFKQSTSAAALSAAAALIAAETNGLALDFTDNTWLASLGFYGSARIKDISTPANEYDSSPTKAASSLLTYTSPSPKLCLGPAGVYRYQAHNFFLNSANGAAWTTARTNVTTANGATDPLGGTNAVTITATGANGRVVSATSAGPGLSPHSLTVWIRRKTGSGTINWESVNVGAGASITLTTSWQQFTCPETSASTSTWYIGFRIATSGDEIEVYAPHLRRAPSDSTYLATTSAARYDLPFEWNTSGVLQRILTEEARTNLLTYCSDLTNAAWTKDNVTAVKTATGPDGVANSATTLKEASGSFSNFRVYVLLTSYTGAYTISLYAKANGRDRMEIRKPDGGDGAWVRFDLTNITATDSGSGPTATSTIVDVGNGWRRCSITVTAAASVTTAALIQLVDSSNNRNYTGDGASGVHVWGVQLEAGSTATSPIETLGSTVTRVSDLDKLGIAKTAFPWNSGTGTLKIDGVVTSPTTDASNLLIVPRSGQTGIQSYLWVPS